MTKMYENKIKYEQLLFMLLFMSNKPNNTQVMWIIINSIFFTKAVFLHVFNML